MALAAAQRHEEALQKVMEALALGEPTTPLIWRFLTSEHSALNHWREALANGRVCVREISQQPRAYPYRQDILRECETAVRDALQHDGHVQVSVTQAPAGTRVMIGESLDPTLAAIGRPVGSGEVVVEVSAPRHATQRQSVTVEADRVVPVSLRLEPEPVLPMPPRPPVCVNCPPQQTPQGPGAWPWVLVGTGLAALAGGGVATFFWYDRRESFLEACPNYLCRGMQSTYNDNAHFLTEAGVFRGVAIGAFTYGAFAIGGGLAWYFLSRPRARSAGAPPVSAWVQPWRQGTMLGIEGRF